MKRRLIPLTIIASVAVLLTTTLAPAWTRDVGLDVWNFPLDEADLREARARQRELVAIQCEKDLRRSTAEQIRAQLIDNQISLLVAAELLNDLYADQPLFVASLCYNYNYDGLTDQVRLAQMAIAAIDSDLMDEPSRRADVIHRLEAELMEMKEYKGN